MPLEITIDSQTLLNETRRKGVMGKIGWDTKSMDAVRTALDAYHLDKNNTLKRTAVINAVFGWKLKNPKEFENRDVLGNGIVRKLAVQCGLDDYRPPPTPSVMFHGETRASPAQRKEPRVTPLMDSVVNVLRANAATSAVIVIDLYGDDFDAQGLNQRYGTDHTVSENVVELLQATRFDGTRGQVNVPVYVCSKDTTKVGSEIVALFKNEIANPSFELVRSKTNSVIQGTGLRDKLNGVSQVFVTGFDANMCVAVSIFGSGGTGVGTYIPGLLDYGFDVVTSRYIVASGTMPLRTQDGWPYMGPCNK